MTAPGPQQPDEVLIEAVTFIGRWVDASLADRVQEVRDRVRITKVCEESGEVWSALDRVYGANPRKTGSWDEVDKELLDTAGAALGAIEYRRGYDGQSLRLLADHMAGVAARAAAHAAWAEVHEPHEDDGVTYCGWASGTGVTDGCGELWPCSTVRARPAAPSAQPDELWPADCEHCCPSGWSPNIDQVPAEDCPVHGGSADLPAQPVPDTDQPDEERVNAAADALQEELHDLLPPGSYAWYRFARIALAAAAQPVRNTGEGRR